MHYFIDGYNLMFRTMHAGDDLQTQRERIIQDINKKAQFLELNVTIVFDAHYQYGESTRSHFDHLEIFFTNSGETADDFILHELKGSKNPQLETVVTSDKKLSWLSRRQMAKTETVEEFMNWLTKRYRSRLKQIKKEREAALSPPAKLVEQPLPPTPEEENLLPSSSASIEDCYNYYLQSFEKEVDQLQSQEKKSLKQPEKISTKIPQQREPQEKEEEISDMERWLRAFQKGGRPEDHSF